MRGLLIILLAITTCQPACTPYMRESALMVSGMAVSGLIACDNRQTDFVSDHGQWDRTTTNGAREAETNPLLGAHPSESLLDGVAGAAIATTMLVATSKRLPLWARITYLSAVAVAETTVVISNSNYATGFCGVH